MSIKFSKAPKNNRIKLKKDRDRSSLVKSNDKPTRSGGIKIKGGSNRPSSVKSNDKPTRSKEIKIKGGSTRSSNVKFNGKPTRSKGISIRSGASSSKRGLAFKKWMLIPIIAVPVIAVIAVIVLGGGGTIGNIGNIGNNGINGNNSNEILSVSMSSLPTKLVYYVGEEPSYTGFAVTTQFSNGTEFTEGPEACTFSGFNSEFPVKEQEITVTYGEHTFIYTVEIKERPRPFSPLTKISLESLPKTEYKVGDGMNVNNGVLLLEYEDGSTRRIRLEHKYVYDFSTDTPGVFTVTVKYREDGILQTCTYEITVTE